jgi:undecaprenyl phosphate N,N'-diacetylbacillosamine 1-phosphate transferase
MYKTYGKRALDILIGFLALPVVLAVLILVGPVIYMEDKGPVLYKATRRGKGGNAFTMYKLRTMDVNSPDLRNPDGSTYSSPQDTRVTRVGRVLRKTSLDEIPQFLNVLKGDMSVVGPRPTLATKNSNKLDPVRKKRLSIRPGLTGYSQAYFRNSISQAEKYAHDCYYVDHLSFALDMKVIWKTVQTVIFRENIHASGFEEM